MECRRVPKTRGSRKTCLIYSSLFWEDVVAKVSSFESLRPVCLSYYGPTAENFSAMSSRGPGFQEGLPDLYFLAVVSKSFLFLKFAARLSLLLVARHGRDRHVIASYLPRAGVPGQGPVSGRWVSAALVNTCWRCGPAKCRHCLEAEWMCEGESQILGSFLITKT